MPGFQELMVIGLVAMVVLGPQRFATVARDGAKLLARFRQEAQGTLRDLKAQAGVEGLGRELRGVTSEFQQTRDDAVQRLRAEPNTRPEGPAAAEHARADSSSDASTTGMHGRDEPSSSEPVTD